MEAEVVAVGGLALLQDRGRPGYAHLGVPRAGALDPAAAGLANRLVGNAPGAAVLEVIGPLELRVADGRWAARVGAGAPTTQWVRPGGTLRVAGAAGAGLRTYVAIAGGFDVAPVLGSRSTDTLAWVGPPPLAAGMRLPLGAPTGPPAAVDVVASRRRSGELRVLPGPASHALFFPHGASDVLGAWRVEAASNRVGIRLGALDGRVVRRADGELASEGTVLGAIQVPPSGTPIVLLHDHGPTGGYPVVGVVHPEDLWQWAQAVPGEVIRLVPRL